MACNRNDIAVVYSSTQLSQCCDPESMFDGIFSFQRPNLRSARQLANFNSRLEKYHLFYTGTRKLITVSKAVFVRLDGLVLNIDGALYKVPDRRSFTRRQLYKMLHPFVKVTDRVEPQGDYSFSSFFSGLSLLKNFITSTGEIVNKSGGLSALLESLLEIIADAYLLTNLNMTKINDIVVALFKLYRMSLRVMNISSPVVSQSSSSFSFTQERPVEADWWYPQSLDAFSLSLLVGLVPSPLFDILKKINLFTNRKLLDDMNWIYDLIGHVLEYFITMLQLLHVPASVVKTIRGLLDYLPFAPRAMYIYNMRDLVAKYQASGNLITQDAFRDRVKALQLKISADSDFVETQNRSPGLRDHYLKFITLYKSILSYEETTRVEPCLIVFEGPPGCLKSVTMQQLVSCFKHEGKSVYSHTFKPLEDTKDWYDTYDNQDILLADDVGQQSISQWRHMINLVSPIKYPLDCAAAHLKHTKYFNSELLMVTTNNFSRIESVTPKDCIGNVSALFRRGYVFDFQVTRQGGEIVGDVVFKHYNISTNSSSWVVGFPNDFICSLPTSFKCQAGNRSELLRWMFHLITQLNTWKKTQNDDNALSPETIEAITAPLVQAQNISISVDSGITPTFLQHLPTVEYFRSSYMDVLQGIYNDCITSIISLFGTLSSITKDHMFLIFWVVGTMSCSYLFCRWLQQDPMKYSASDDPLLLVEPHVVSAGPTSVQALSNSMHEVRLSYSVSVSLQEKEKLGWDPEVQHFTDVDIFTIGLFSGHYLLIPGHSIPVDTASVSIYRDRKSNSLLLENVTAHVAWRSIKEDVCLLSLPRTMISLGASRAKHFIPEKSKQVGHNLWYLTPRGYFPLDPFLINDRTYGSLIYDVFTEFPDYTVELSLDPRRDLTYKEICKPGLCGNLIYNTTNGVIGMHIAGAGDLSRSFARVWSKDTISQIKSFLSSDTDYFIDVPLKPDATPNAAGAKLDVRGDARTQHVSSLIPTPINGLLGGVKTPADLVVYGNHTVKDIGKRVLIPTKTIPSRDLDFASQALSLMLVPFKEVSDYDTIKGFHNIAAINKDSSSGYRFTDSKDTYIDFEKGALRPVFQAEVDELKARLISGDLLIHDLMSVEHVKDELRPPSKEGVPRTFQVLRLPLIFLQKKFLAPIADHIIETRHFHGIVIGMNPFKEWPILYQALKRTKVFDGDVKWFERCLTASFQMMVNETVLRFYIGENKRLLEALLSSLIWSFVMMNDDIWFKNHGMLTGSWVTALFNSFYRLAQLMMWYFNYSLDPTPARFFEDLVNYVQGDDAVTGVKDIPRNKQLSNLSMSLYMEKIGVGYTDGNKNKVAQPFIPLDEVVFLKRSFSFHPTLQQIVCPLSMDTIKSMPDYFDKSKDMAIVLDGKLNCMQRELFLHYSQSEYDRLLSQLAPQIFARDVPFTRLPYQYLVNLYTTDLDEFSRPILEAKFGDYGLMVPTEDVTLSVGGQTVFAQGIGRNYSPPLPRSKKAQFRLRRMSGTKSYFVTNINIHPQTSASSAVPLVAMDYHEGGEPTHPDLYNAVAMQSVKDNIQSIATRYFSDFKMKTPLDGGSMYCDVNPVSSVSDSLKMNFDELVSKPFFIKTVSWTSTNSSNTLLTAGTINVPRDLLVNELANIPFKASSYWRGCVRLYVQVHGTPLHAGIILVSAGPSTFGSRGVNSDLIAPHVFLDANNASGAVLEVPFYIPARLMQSSPAALDTVLIAEEAATATVTTRVVNALQVSTNATSSLSISYYAMFTDLEFYVPHTTPVFRATPQSMSSVLSSTADSVAQNVKTMTSDFIDRLRGTFRQYTGLHNPNIPYIQERMIRSDENFQNIVDGQTLFEKLDPYASYDRIAREEVFNTPVDEMMLTHMLKKPQLIATLNITTGTGATAAGSQLACFPITPLMVAPTSAASSTGDTRNYPLIQKLHAMSRYWRGSMKLIFQPSMTNFQFFRLQVSRDYSVSPTSAAQYPTMASCTNMPTSFLEFSAGGQLQEVLLPFNSPLIQLPCTLSPEANAVQHGLAYVFLTAPAVSSANAPSSIPVNVYLVAGDDFEFFGYTGDNVVQINSTLARIDEVDEVEPEPMEVDETPLRVFAQTAPIAATPYNVSVPAPLVNTNAQDTSVSMDLEFRPIVSTRDYLRRFYKVADTKLPSNAALSFGAFRLTDLLFRQPNNSPIKSLLSEYNGFIGGFKFKVIAIGCPAFQVKYFPPCWDARAAGALGATTLNALTGGLISTTLPTLNTPLESSSSPYVWSSRALVVNGRDDIRAYNEAYASNASQAEFVIPNLNPFKFTQITPNGLPNITSGDLGMVVFSPILLNVGGDEVDAVRFQIYAAVEDNFRAGQHCRNFPFKYATNGSGAAASIASSTTSTAAYTSYNSPLYYRRTVLPAVP